MQEIWYKTLVMEERKLRVFSLPCSILAASASFFHEFLNGATA
jgi:hypothetical protein